MNNLSINIADIIINVDSEIDFNRFRDINFYKDFITKENEHCHCKLNLKVESPSFFSFLNTLQKPDCSISFNPAGNWKLSELNGKHILQVGFSNGKGKPEEVIVFNSDYTNGTIYMKYIFELFRRFSDQFILINLLSKNHGFLLHSAGLILKNKGICFVGRSGAGKSTLVKLFSNEVEKQDLLNDDRVAIKNCQNNWFIFGTPYYGEIAVASNRNASLKAIFFIRHSNHNYIHKLSCIEVCEQLIKHTLMPFWDKQAMMMVIDTFEDISREIHGFEIGFLPDKKIIDLIKSVI